MAGLEARLEIKPGMSVQEVQKNGNLAQQKAATIFDTDFNGYYDTKEAKMFESKRFTYDVGKDEIVIRSANKNDKTRETVNLKEHDAEYAQKFKEREEEEKRIDNNIKELTKYGLGKWQGWAEQIEKISTKNVNGVKHLLIETEAYKLDMPLDKNYAPEKFGFCGGEGTEGFVGFNGTITIKKDYYYQYDFVDSNCTVICNDGNEDIINYTNSKVTVKTGDYADTVNDGDDITHLRPGTKTFDNRVQK